MTNDEPGRGDPETAEMLFPFVVVKSKGGSFDDAAFCAGYECGMIDRDLNVLALHSESMHDRVVHRRNLPQLDLIAMHHGFNMVDKTEDAYTEGYARVCFHLASEQDV